MWAYGRGQTHRHTDARDHNTFSVVYDSRKMSLDSYLEYIDGSDIARINALLHGLTHLTSRPVKTHVTTRGDLRSRLTFKTL